MKTHPPASAAFAVLSFLLMMVLFMYQAHLAMQENGVPRFSMTHMIAFGYGSSSPVCGDGVKAGAEGCDDGDTSSGDGCSASCTVESGYSCTGTAPSVCVTVCGDSIVAGSEACDAGGEALSCDDDCTAVVCGDSNVNAAASEECDDGASNASTAQCTTGCRRTYCGDGIVQAPNGTGNTELCEPSLTSTCTNACVTATGIGTTFTPTPPSTSSAGNRRPPPPNCGNGVLEITKGEECDNGRFNGLSPQCDRWCHALFCGDGIVQKQNGEECEPVRTAAGIFIVPQCGRYCNIPVCDTTGLCSGGCTWSFLPACTLSSQASSVAPVTSAQSSSSFRDVQNAIADGIEQTTGPLAGTSQASSRLSIQSLILPVSGSSVRASSVSSVPAETVTVCGDGIRTSDEECDRGEADNLLGYGCTPTCKISICGNASLEPGEECDDGKRNSRFQADSCSTLCLLPRCGDGIVDPAFGERCDNGIHNSGYRPDACRLNCVRAFCGDNVTDSTEQCDDGPAGSTSCTTSCVLTSTAMTYTVAPPPAAPDSTVSLLLFLLALLIVFVHKLDRMLHVSR